MLKPDEVSSPIASIKTDSVEGTQLLATSIIKIIQPGDIIVLSGDLGAGKTVFTQGLGIALGVKVPITSPTFTLANRYEGKLLLNHLDVYRLNHIEEVQELGIHELVDSNSLTVIEWGDAISGALPGGYLEICLNLGLGAEDRIFDFRVVGSEWLGRKDALKSLVDSLFLTEGK